MKLNEPAIFYLVFFWVAVPVIALSLGIRRLRRTWPFLVYAAFAGAYMYWLWTHEITVGMLLLAIPLVVFGWYLKRRGV
jgi:uncharacterized membrane protein YhaH (DUF805 family)